MRLEIYPTYARRLNRIIEDARRLGKDRSDIWSELLEQTVAMIERDDNGGLTYPIQLSELRPSPRDKSNLRKISRLSERARWVFLSLSALKILEREASR